MARSEAVAEIGEKEAPIGVPVTHHKECAHTKGYRGKHTHSVQAKHNILTIICEKAAFLKITIIFLLYI